MSPAQFTESAEDRQHIIEALVEEIEGLKATLDIEVNKTQPQLMRQINAVPDLLEALVEMIELVKTTEDYYNELMTGRELMIIEKSERAIAKAKGGRT